MYIHTQCICICMCMCMCICIYVWTSQPMGWFGCSFFFFQTFWRFEKGWLQWLLKTQVHRLWCGSRPLVSAVGNWQKCRRNSLRWWGAPSWDSDGSTLMFGSPKDTPAFNHQVLVCFSMKSASEWKSPVGEGTDSSPSLQPRSTLEMTTVAPLLVTMKPGCWSARSPRCFSVPEHDVIYIYMYSVVITRKCWFSRENDDTPSNVGYAIFSDTLIGTFDWPWIHWKLSIPETIYLFPS